MTTEQKTAIKQQLVSMIDTKKLSQAEAARQMGMSAPTLWNIINNAWDKVSTQMWNRVAAWCGYSEKTWLLLETRQLTTVVNLLNDAQENSRMLALCANTGLGKTTAIKYYHQNNANVYYMLCTVTMTRNDFVSELQTVLGLDVPGNLHKRLQSVIDKLADAEFPLLILDDAGKLNEGCLRLIQIIYDSLEHRVGIVLVGTLQLRKFIFAGAAKDRQGFRELKRRIAYWETLHAPDASTISVFCRELKIVDANAIAFVKRKCQDFGTMRELLTNAQRIAARHNCPISLSILESVHVGDVLEA
ncbi:AAA family ATPase [Nodularia spumigena]|uniref:AAA family ATPase n=1 Tax=Nodularia spumigena TaxID=70799 RepID=UPI00232D6AB6|nr:AAA family ATPase [Nodularia spumigena]MDB9500039.1 AAA family ATPase [Nodularia spumigena CS-336/02]